MLFYLIDRKYSGLVLSTVGAEILTTVKGLIYLSYRLYSYCKHKVKGRRVVPLLDVSIVSR